MKAFAEEQERVHAAKQLRHRGRRQVDLENAAEMLEAQPLARGSKAFRVQRALLNKPSQLRSRLQAPFVRSGFIPGLDYAPALAGAQTDVELVTETLGNYAGVTPEQRRRDMLDGRWMALHTDEPGAARPHLVDRMGRAIDRGRPEQPPLGMARRRVPHTPYAELARRGVQVVANPPVAPRAAPGPPPAMAPAA